MRNSAKQRAKKKGLPFDLELADISIPAFCPALGIPLFVGAGRGPKPNAPSLDRIVPELGYVRGNVAVISYKANAIKSTATAEEIERVAQWLRTISNR